uniref:FkbM family methyltransferase n=1 Tax=Thermodesulfobacterium geofontis TaxID=1295609 RepID=A0A7V6CDL8_9BACT
MDFSIENKRKFFLERLTEQYRKTKAQKFDVLFGSGLRKKFQRLIFTPNIYLLYIFFRLISRIYPKEIIKSVELFLGKRVHVSITDQDGLFLFLFGLLLHGPDYRLTKFLIKNLKQNDIFYDIGANHGFYTYLALEFCRGVHSFEPLPDLLNELKRNLKEVVNVFLNNVALSNKIGNTFLFISSPYFKRISTINEKVLDSHYLKFRKRIKVKTTTLDEYVKTHNKPTFIKIDTEGSENLVIDGRKKFFKQQFSDNSS